MSHDPGRGGQNSGDAGVVGCVYCRAEIVPGQTSYILSCSKCTTCSDCLLDKHATSGAFLFRCPCKLLVTSHSKRIGDREVLCRKYPSELHPLDVLRRSEEAATFASSNQKRKGDAVMVLYRSVLYRDEMKDDSTETNVLQTKLDEACQTLSLVGIKDATDTVPPATLDSLGRFFSTLHTWIVQRSVTPHGKVQSLRPDEFCDFIIKNQTILSACLYGLATGTPNIPINRMNESDFKSGVLATGAAHDLVLRCKTGWPLHLQFMFSDQLNRQNMTTSFHEVMSLFKLVMSRNCDDRKKCREVCNYLRKGVKVRPRDMVILNGDNVGFLKLGMNCSYDQWLLCVDILIRASRLQDIDIDTDEPKDPSRLDRKPTHDFLDLVKEDKLRSTPTLAKELVGVNPSDIDKLTNSVMEHIHQAIEIEKKGAVVVGGSVTKAGYFISHESKVAFIENQHVDPDNTGYSIDPTAEVVNRRISQVVNSEADVYQVKEVAASSLLGPDSTVNAVHADLSLKSTTFMIAQYCWDLRKKTLYTWYTLASDDEKADFDALPAYIIGAFFCCDGQPANQLLKMVTEDNRRFYLGDESVKLPDLFPDSSCNEWDGDAEFDLWFDEVNSHYGLVGKGKNKGSRFYGKFFAFPGGFHACLKFHNMCGDLFGNFLALFFRAWRDTPSKIEWILRPKDPTQLEEELWQYVLAHYRSAYIYCKSSFSREPTPAEVHKYMVDLAGKSPIKLAVLLHLRYAEISIMMRVSAKLGERGCVETFLCAVRFGLTLWSMTHAVDYVRLGCDLLMTMHCASPALKRLYSKEIFTRLTATNNSMPTDLAMEKVVREVRSREGKIHRAGIKRRMEHAAFLIPNNPTERQSLDSLRSGAAESKTSKSRSEEYLSADSPLIKCHDLIHHQMKVWHPTEEINLDGGRGKKGRKKRRRDSEVDPYSFGKNESLNSDVLKTFVLGSIRVVEYFQRYYVDNPFSVDRSEDEVSLTKILATHADREVEWQKFINRSISTSHSELEKAMIVSELREALANEISSLNFDTDLVVPEIPPPMMKKLKKPELINELIVHRRKLFDIIPSLESDRRKEAKGAFDTLYPPTISEANLQELLSSDIFKLSDGVLNKDRYSNALE